MLSIFYLQDISALHFNILVDEFVNIRVEMIMEFPVWWFLEIVF